MNLVQLKIEFAAGFSDEAIGQAVLGLLDV